MMNKATDAECVISDLKELEKLTADENGAQRVAWTPVWDLAREWFIKKMKLEGADVIVDSAYNLFAKVQGETDDAICIGSHLDCVPNGGWLDGALGVVAAMGIVKKYGIHGHKPRKTIYATCWADEEGARFGRSCIGSSAVSGNLDIEEAAELKDNNNITFSQALKRYGLKISDFPKAKKEFLDKKVSNYLELHIEQAPVLESKRKSVACVSGICGCERDYITFIGQRAHSGCPISMRHDAFLTAAQAALDFRKIGLKYTEGEKYGYCTVGKVNVIPGVVTIFPGTCTISLDQRHIDKGILKKMNDEAYEACKQTAKSNGVQFKVQKVWSNPPTIFNKKLIELCKQAVMEETGDSLEMYSGPLHDAAEIAKFVPSVMMFVQSKNGLSHCKEEDTNENDLIHGISAFFNLADKVINEQ